jgi:hypothetical protein
MLQEEKDQLIALFHDEVRWCRGVDAVDENGNAVHYDDEKAVSWDVVGALCHLFGWKRACQLFEPISRHISGRRHLHSPTQTQEIAAMSALFDYNDNDTTTFDEFVSQLQALPVWHGKRALG